LTGDPFQYQGPNRTARDETTNETDIDSKL
jgi:hypothetical protein